MLLYELTISVRRAGRKVPKVLLEKVTYGFAACPGVDKRTVVVRKIIFAVSRRGGGSVWRKVFAFNEDGHAEDGNKRGSKSNKELSKRPGQRLRRGNWGSTGANRDARRLVASCPELGVSYSL